MRSAPPFRWPAATGVFVLACILLAFAPEEVQATLAYDRRAISCGELWRLWTGHIVHFSVQHALGDMAVFALSGIFAEKIIGTRRMALALLAGSLVISIALLIGAPALAEYRGASGLCAMIIGGLVALIWKARPQLRQVLTILAGLFAAKIVFDALGASHGLVGFPDGVVVCWQAHVFGAAMGWLLVMWILRYPHGSDFSNKIYDRSVTI